MADIVTKCAAQVAANIAMNCANPITPGLEEIGLLFNRQDIIGYTESATEPRMKTAIQVRTGAKPYIIYNPFTTPFDGTMVDANLEGLIPGYNKTLVFGVPMIGAKVSHDIVEPLLKNRSGFVAIIERKNKQGDGTFVIIGSETGAKCTVQTENFNDVATSGMTVCTLVEEKAQFKEVVLYDSDLTTTKTEFDRLYSLANV